jgi:signal transduction histidine kinase
MGAKKVKVSARSDGKEVVVHVDDDGPGVPTHLRAKIFEMGFSTRPKGSGQGLALLKEVVEEEHSGSIIVADSPLGGARFSIHLPTG